VRVGVVVVGHVGGGAHFRGRGDETVGRQARKGRIGTGHGLAGGRATVPGSVDGVRIACGREGGQIRHSMTLQPTRRGSWRRRRGERGGDGGGGGSGGGWRCGDAGIIGSETKTSNASGACECVECDGVTVIPRVSQWARHRSHGDVQRRSPGQRDMAKGRRAETRTSRGEVAASNK
jgi:hypothetical protein